MREDGPYDGREKYSIGHSKTKVGICLFFPIQTTLETPSLWQARPVAG
jgi:hypothetical protein